MQTRRTNDKQSPVKQHVQMGKKTRKTKHGTYKHTSFIFVSQFGTFTLITNFLIISSLSIYFNMAIFLLSAHGEIINGHSKQLKPNYCKLPTVDI